MISFFNIQLPYYKSANIKYYKILEINFKVKLGNIEKFEIYFLKRRIPLLFYRNIIRLQNDQKQIIPYFYT